jgi:fimbrial chaperone protein
MNGKSYRAAILAAVLSGSMLPHSAMAASVMIWPIDPTIAAGRNGTALWLENRGETPAVMQVRVTRWSQENGEEVQAQQDSIIASPPMVQIAPGVRQLIRLVMPAKQPRQGEQAYRILVDEIPAAITAGPEDAAAPTLRFQMRYSIPLFVYGQKVVGDKKSIPLNPADLSCSITGNGTQISLTNAGSRYFRLTDVVLENGTSSLSVSNGLLGYVLANSTMAWPLPGNAKDRKTLKASLNGGTEQVTIGDCLLE